LLAGDGPVVNLTNILLTAFELISFCQKLQTQTVSTLKLRKTLSNENADFKMLLKLKPVYEGLHHLHRCIIVDGLLEATLILKAINFGGLLIGMTHIRDVAAVREKFAPNRKR